MPLLFNFYMLPLSQIRQNNNVAYHSYADDTQIYNTWFPDDYSLIDYLCKCIELIDNWMCLNFLQLNKDKTEVMISGLVEKKEG